MGIADFVNRLIGKREQTSAASRKIYLRLLRASLGSELSSKEQRELEAAVEALGISPEQVATDHYKLGREAELSTQAAGAEEIRAILKGIKAERTALIEQHERTVADYQAALASFDAAIHAKGHELQAGNDAAKKLITLRISEPLLFPDHVPEPTPKPSLDQVTAAMSAPHGGGFPNPVSAKATPDKPEPQRPIPKNPEHDQNVASFEAMTREAARFQAAEKRRFIARTGT